MRIAYLILAYKQPRQLERLVTRLNTGDTTFLVHIDKKTSADVHRDCVARLSEFPNVCYLERKDCYWGGFGIVRAALEGVAASLRVQPPVDYVVLLTGQDYPIKSNAYIRGFFEQSAGRSYVDHHSVPSEMWPEAARRINRWQIHVLGRMVDAPPEKAGGGRAA